MFPSVFIAPASKYIFSLSKKWPFKLDICSSPGNKHPDLEVFFNTQFDRTGNPDANIESISRFSCSYTLNLTANTCNQKNKSLFTDERNCKAKSLVNAIPSRFLKFAVRCWKEHQHTGLNVFRRFSVFHKMFLGVLKLVTYKIYFRHQPDFPFLIYKSVANANSKQHLLLDRDNNTDRDRGKPSVQIL